ncbi:MAG TPA: HAD-IA family hydrolase [Actinomycetota bacterium]|nr:HAD-IA family hydrolase [Actinomycetota bacterium]
MPIEAVFFDAGETLIHPDPSFPELFAAVMADAGHPLEPEVVSQTATVASKRFQELATTRTLWSTNAEVSRAFWLELYADFLKGMGIDSDHAALAEALYETFSDPGSYAVFPDAIPTLETLRDRGLALGLISNFEEWLELVLEARELTPFFPVRVISGSVGVEKPDPQIFRIALERAGARAEDAVYVGDHPFFDVEAAEAVGMRGVLIDRRERYPDHPGPRLPDLKGLPDLLETL